MRLVEREVPIARDFDRCVIYAVGDKVVWPFLAPPMPPAALRARDAGLRRPSRSTPPPCPW